MNKVSVKYKGRDYQVYNPGELVVLRHVGCKYTLADQLKDGVTPIPRVRPGGLMPYFKKEYDLNEIWEYYFIVVHLADWSNVPKCPICGKPKSWLGLIGGYRESCGDKNCWTTISENKKLSTGYYERTKEIRSEVGTRVFSSLNKDPEFLKKKSEWTTKSNLRRVANGTHPFLNSEMQSRNAKKRIEDGTNPFCKIEVKIKGEYGYFNSLGSPEDTCYFYLAKWNDEPDKIKIGATQNLENRKSRTYRKGQKCYSSIDPIVTDTREVISKMEYDVKIHFAGRSISGTETFPIEMLDEILDYVKSLYNK